MLKFDQALFDEHQDWALAIAREILSRHVREVNHQMFPKQIEQAALTGLWQAVVRYEPERGDFRAFARLRVRGCVMDEYRGIGMYGRVKAVKVVSIEGLNL